MRVCKLRGWLTIHAIAERLRQRYWPEALACEEHPSVATNGLVEPSRSRGLVRNDGGDSAAGWKCRTAIESGPNMPAVLPFAKLDDLAHAVHGVVTKNGWPKASPRPWNPHQPEKHWWWVTPTKDWPAYHVGKFHFSLPDADDADVFCGIEVEKGFGPVIEPLCATEKWRRRIMRDEWIWHRFIDDMATGRVSETVKGCAANLQRPIRLTVIGNPFRDSTDFDPYENDASDKVWFTTRGEELV